MPDTVFERLVRRGRLSRDELIALATEYKSSPLQIECRLLGQGIEKHELLLSLVEVHGLPVVEFDESLLVSAQVMRRIDAEQLKQRLWFPLSVSSESARVIAWDPQDPRLRPEITETLGVGTIEYLTALPSDLIRIIEHNQDLNPAFPAGAARTPLAKVRTFLADRRSLLSCSRTTLAQGRTGLAFLRTGISFTTLGLVLYRIFGSGFFTPIQAGLLVGGLVMAVDGVRWYLPVRQHALQRDTCAAAMPSKVATVLTATWTGDSPVFTRTAPVPGSGDLREQWDTLSPVMRRRFLANDRTDYAEERTVLACLRTRMAVGRTNLAFARTGIAIAGLGIALVRLERFRTPLWTVFDALLVAAGLFMIGTGVAGYLPGRAAGKTGQRSVDRAENEPTIWESLFPPAHTRPLGSAGESCRLPVTASQAPGIWATTGLALERTVLAERRNIMARLRTIMARSRTGLAFIRTGMSISGVGFGLLAAFGASSPVWAGAYGALAVLGILFIADGLYWHLPAERTRRQFPYCYCDVELTVPDYGKPAREWTSAVFSHDDL